MNLFEDFANGDWNIWSHNLVNSVDTHMSNTESLYYNNNSYYYNNIKMQRLSVRSTLKRAEALDIRLLIIKMINKDFCMYSFYLQKRFWSKISITTLEDCWLWNRYLDKDGYGTFYYDGSSEKAHRFSYKLFNI